MRFLVLLPLLLVCLSCATWPLQNAAAGKNKFADAEMRRIYTLQDERKTEALLAFLAHEKPAYRQAAASALASLQDAKAIPSLAPLLQDPQPEVRRAAAYALGQTLDAAAEAPLLQAAAAEAEAVVQAELLEALGKRATQTGLNYLAALAATEAKAAAGQAWGLFRTHNKSLDYLAATRKAVDLLQPHHSQEARLGAAHFLARTPHLDLNPFLDLITQSALTDAAPEVRMALAQSLGKMKSAATPLLTLLQKDADYRVRINALRALTQTDFHLVKEAVYQALNDRQVNTALAAAELLLAQAPPGEAASLFSRAQQAQNWRVRATLLAAALKASPGKNQVRQYIGSLYQTSMNPYEKGALLSALSQDTAAWPFIEAQTFSGATVPGTYGLQALIDIRTNPAFPAALAAHFAGLFRRAIASGDVALVGLAAGVLQQPALDFKAAYPDLTFLKTAQNRLQLPRDMETYQELEKAFRFLQGLPPAASPRNPYTHPIDWDLVQGLDPRQQVRLQTSKGLITLELLVEESPGSVANFVALVQAGFFNGKNFHRVVPNFVVQGGDPRGDGWGGPDYAIRTELSNLRFREGDIGMASAGKDTEGCQWFITHSPTPHLDGRYSLFARVIGGREIVHLLEIGDTIESAALVKD